MQPFRPSLVPGKLSMGPLAWIVQPLHCDRMGVGNTFLLCKPYSDSVAQVLHCTILPKYSLVLLRALCPMQNVHVPSDGQTGRS